MNKPQRLTRQNPASFKAGIVHLGPGNFFRAFAAVYTQEAMEDSGGDWGIVAVSLKSTTARDQLLAQGGAYTSITLSPSNSRTDIIESIVDVLVAPENPQSVLDAMSQPSIRIVSLTITEKGYCHDPSTGNLNVDHADIAHDIEGGAPRSAIGFIVQALALRKKAGLSPFTVMSCDNLPNNGQLTKHVVLQLAKQQDAQLAIWIDEQVSFPSTMVDRIAPATTEHDIEQLRLQQGYIDLACVTHEDFREWVIEDNFCAGRPNWKTGNVQFVESVTGHELKKLRCLNGTHSALAYLGYLAGYETIADTVADPAFSQLCHKLWQTEIIPTVPAPSGVNLQDYCSTLLERYRNPAIRHRTWQIAMDGSQKIPQRLLGTLCDNLLSNRPIDGIALVLAAWMRYVSGVDESGNEIDVRDPMASQLRTLASSTATAEETVKLFLGMSAVFGQLPKDNSRVEAVLTRVYASLLEHGTKDAVKLYVS